MSVPQELGINQIENKNLVKSMLKKIRFGGVLNLCNFRKKGDEAYSIQKIIYRIIVVLYQNKPLKALWESGNGVADCFKQGEKDSYYRTLKNSRLNWRKLMLTIFTRISNPLCKLSKQSQHVLILDDTGIKKRGKKFELLSRQYDHSKHQHYCGYTQVYLGWSDGISYLPVDFCIKVGEKIVSSWHKVIDGRTSGAKRRKESVEKKLDQCLAMLKRAYQSGIEVGAVVYDTWFAKPVFILDVLKIGYHSICHLPRNDRMWQFLYNGNKVTFKDLYRMLMNGNQFVKMKIGNLNQEVASLIVSHHNGLKLKLVFCRSKHKKEWIVIASTDTSLSEYQILEHYAKRWSIETFFEDSKQLLKLGKEQSIDFDVQVAMTTIRAIAYSLAVAIKRNMEDERTLGKLFESIQNEFARLNLDREILTLIFEMILDYMELPSKLAWEIRNVFQIIAENFCSGFKYKQKYASSLVY